MNYAHTSATAKSDQPKANSDNGEIPAELNFLNFAIDQAMALASLAKEITDSMQTEVNIAKAKISLGDNGKALGEITHLGKMLIQDENIPTLSGQ